MSKNHEEPFGTGQHAVLGKTWVTGYKLPFEVSLRGQDRCLMAGVLWMKLCK